MITLITATGGTVIVASVNEARKLIGSGKPGALDAANRFGRVDNSRPTVGDPDCGGWRP